MNKFVFIEGAIADLVLNHNMSKTPDLRYVKILSQRILKHCK